MPVVKMTVEQFKDYLHKLDDDGDYRINVKELRSGLSKLGLYFAGWKTRRAMAYTRPDNEGYIYTDKDIDKLVEYARKNWDIVE